MTSGSARNSAEAGQILFAEQALLPTGWAQDVLIRVDAAGRITEVTPNAKAEGTRRPILLPAPTNLHSHAFQRAMAGMSERRGPEKRDTFWTWRQIMFRFLDVLTPEDVQAIAALVQVEMAEAGYACVGEFHYLHHQPGGTPYDALGEMSERIVAAAQETGLGLTLLPVLYSQGGCDGRPLGAGQIRFGNDPDRFLRLHEAAGQALSGLPEDARLGVAPHSLRAVTPEGLRAAVSLAGQSPIHMHLAEQVAEVTEVEAAYGQRPVDYLLAQHEVGPRWCLIHCTQMTDRETRALAATGAVAGLCPITESSLGDGIFNGVTYLEAAGRIGLGSDSNIRISLSEELRTLEYSQRLRDLCRASVATQDRSTGRVLFDASVAGGAQAARRSSGSIEVGQWADVLALDGTALDLEGRDGDALLDSWIFAGSDAMVTDLWSAGRHIVRDGRHIKGDAVREGYRQTMRKLRQKL
ncbi:formimidoylglutamate deiminase [Pseudooceanicola sp. HF7]|uniref:formimidoylglutamate deiminase n=1 Tax=Pseudooceanicola sp. HF7 TaxID=2721560 RepID=UPI0014313A87|nr:formimidoylglutamate deiminase [Pseudooceanicola sp. HF7]NIZ09069.1 formimidoylglutamate deiminase [Pseudooceanicola sp. HF7]